MKIDQSEEVKIHGMFKKSVTDTVHPWRLSSTNFLSIQLPENSCWRIWCWWKWSLTFYGSFQSMIPFYKIKHIWFSQCLYKISSCLELLSFWLPILLSMVLYQVYMSKPAGILIQKVYLELGPVSFSNLPDSNMHHQDRLV